MADSLDRAGSDSVRSSDRRRRGNPAGYTCRDYRSPGGNSTWNRSWNDSSVLFKRSHADPGNLLFVFSGSLWAMVAGLGIFGHVRNDFTGAGINPVIRETGADGVCEAC